jgi:hypothetical protein
MLAHVRSCFLLSVAFFVAACLPVHAQINGVPASVTSYGFGGSTNPNPGVRSSVTSLGPNGYSNRPIFGNCCTNFFLPSNPNPPLFSGRRHRRGDRDHGGRDRGDHGRSFYPIISEPVYIPYAAYDADDEDDSVDADADYIQAPAPRTLAGSAKRPRARDLATEAGASGKPGGNEPAEREQAEPVAAPQPSTVLVFKDGHQSDVVNYAILGDTLFDFGSGRTHKILLGDLDLPATRKTNDDHGVDFRVPTGAGGQ